MIVKPGDEPRRVVLDLEPGSYGRRKRAVEAATKTKQSGPTVVPGTRKPVSVHVMSKYPEDVWSAYQVWCVSFTSGPAEYWVVDSTFVAGHRVVSSSHDTLAEAMAARAGMGHGIGAG